MECVDDYGVELGLGARARVRVVFGNVHRQDRITVSVRISL